MDSELIAAVKERIERGYSTEAIRGELQASGHSEEVIDRVLLAAERGNESDTGISPVPEATSALPKVSTLISSGISFTKQRLGLAAALATLLIIILFADYAEKTSLFGEEMVVLLVLSLVTIGALIGYFLLLGTTLRLVAVEQENPSFQEGFTWAKKNFWSLLWVYILTSLVTLGGTFLFIVPGIVLSFLVYFSQYVLVTEDKKGMAALLRSRDLVKGRWWLVVTTLFKIALIFFGVLLLFGLVVGVGMAVAGDSPVTKLIVESLGQIASVILTIVGLHIGMSLYRSLVDSYSAESQKPAKKWQYVVFSLLGVVFFLGMVGAVAMLEDAYVSEDFENAAVDDTTAKQRALELRETLIEKVSPDEEEAE